MGIFRGLLPDAFVLKGYLPVDVSVQGLVLNQMLKVDFVELCESPRDAARFFQRLQFLSTAARDSQISTAGVPRNYRSKMGCNADLLLTVVHQHRQFCINFLHRLLVVSQHL